MQLAAPRRILVVGNGARENALANAVLLSPAVERLWITPACWGLLDPHGQRISVLPHNALDSAAICRSAVELGIDLCVIGPEAPLCAGLADELRALGIPACGPGAAAARLEGSKTYAKRFMRRHGIPTADFLELSGVFNDPAGAIALALDWAGADLDGPGLVIKADGLASGKGVHVVSNRAEAVESLSLFTQPAAFGDSASTLIVERRLFGPEISFTVLIAGGQAEVLPCCSDYKRLLDGDKGPNTGGMGNICPSPWAGDEVVDEFCQTILHPFMAGLRAEGLDYRGFLFVGTMLTPRGLQVIEFNCRLGDPEAAVLLPLLETDWPALFASIAAGELPRGAEKGGSVLRLRDEAAVAVVLAGGSYPYSASAPQPLDGIGRVAARGLLRDPEAANRGAFPPVSIFCAGVGRTADSEGLAAQDAYPQPDIQPDGLLAGGGRVLTVSARAADLSEARRLAYEVAGNLRFEGAQLRSDIGRLR